MRLAAQTRPSAADAQLGLIKDHVRSQLARVAELERVVAATADAPCRPATASPITYRLLLASDLAAM